MIAKQREYEQQEREQARQQYGEQIMADKDFVYYRSQLNLLPPLVRHLAKLTEQEMNEIYLIKPPSFHYGNYMNVINGKINNQQQQHQSSWTPRTWTNYKGFYTPPSGILSRCWVYMTEVDTLHNPVSFERFDDICAVEHAYIVVNVEYSEWGELLPRPQHHIIDHI